MRTTDTVSQAGTTSSASGLCVRKPTPSQVPMWQSQASYSGLFAPRAWLKCLCVRRACLFSAFLMH